MPLLGTVVGLEANRPTVEADSGERYLCYLRGRVKRVQGRILVGDRVVVEPTDPGEAMILEVASRRNQLERPLIANITGVLAVFTIREPVGNLALLDRRLVLAELEGLRASVVIAKADLATPEAVSPIRQCYAAAGYSVHAISSVTGEGVADLAARRDGVWVLTGESGTGKSSLVNRLCPERPAQVGELSRIGRGRQTTRTVWLWRVDSSWWLADAPGFASLDLPPVDPIRLRTCFHEWDTMQCRFDDCLHVSEPGCQVREAFQDHPISGSRYQHYLEMLQESKLQRPYSGRPRH